MGAICGGDDANRNNGVMSDKLNKPQGMYLYGDWFDADTRTVVALLKLGNVSYTWKQVD